jgi:spore germination protein GerM
MKQVKKHTAYKEIAKQEVKPKRESKTFKSTSDALSSLINGPKSDGKAKGRRQRQCSR